MVVTPFLRGIIAAAAGEGGTIISPNDPTTSYQGTVTDATADTAYSFTGFSLSEPPTALRKLLIAVGTFNTGATQLAPSDVEVNSVPAELLFTYTVDSGTNFDPGFTLWLVDLPTGTSIDIDITLAHTADAIGVSVWAFTGADAWGRYDRQVGAGTGTPPTLNIDIPAEGSAIGVGMARSNGGPVRFATGDHFSEAGETGRAVQLATAGTYSGLTQGANDTITGNLTGQRNALMVASIIATPNFITPISFDFMEQRNSTSDATAGITFAACDFGAADPDREIVVVYGGNNSANSAVNGLTSMTIGGVSAVKDAGHSVGSAGTHCEIWRATVPTGTTGDVVVTAGAGTAVNRVSIAVYRMLGRETPGAGPADDTALQQSTGTTGNAGRDLFIPAGGVGLIALDRNNANPITWTSISEDFGNSPGSNAYNSGGRLPSNYSRAVLTNWSSSGTTNTTCAAASYK